jgi:hypothetical protein
MESEKCSIKMIKFRKGVKDKNRNQKQEQQIENSSK